MLVQSLACTVTGMGAIGDEAIPLNKMRASVAGGLPAGSVLALTNMWLPCATMRCVVLFQKATLMETYVAGARTGGTGGAGGGVGKNERSPGERKCATSKFTSAYERAVPAAVAVAGAVPGPRCTSCPCAKHGRG